MRMNRFVSISMVVSSRAAGHQGRVEIALWFVIFWFGLAAGPFVSSSSAAVIEVAKLIASDGATGDDFGFSVAVSGDTMVIGARGDEADRGSAYVYIRSGRDWIQQAKLTASDGLAGDWFGNSVAISGDTVVVGAYFDDISPNNVQGSAYVFVKPGPGWSNMTQTAKLTASDGAAGDRLGTSVGISGDTVVAGAIHDDVGPNMNQGSAYVFVKPGPGWSNMTQTAKLTASDGALNDGLGTSVAISGDTVVAGAVGDDIGPNADQGSAYVFLKPGPGWSNMTQTAKLTASDGAANDRLGESMSASSDTVVVGAAQDDIGANVNQGSAYVFVKPGPGWSNMTQTAKLTASDGAANDFLGFSATISGDIVVLGAWGDDIVGLNDGQGSAYVFIKPGVWINMTQSEKVTASDGAAGDTFGWSVGVSGETIVVGAYFDDVGANNFQGSATVFTLGVRFVDANATAPADGSSWFTAYRNLRDALAEAAVNPDVVEIWVANGTYKPTNKSCVVDSECPGGTCDGQTLTCTWAQPREQTFQLINGVAIYGGFRGSGCVGGPNHGLACTVQPDCSPGGVCDLGETDRDQRDPAVNITTLTGDVSGNDAPVACTLDSQCGSFGGLCVNGFCIISNNNGENSYRVVTGSGTNATAILDGFTIQAGHANGAYPRNYGAGMFNSFGSPTVNNCAFRGNSTNQGGGGIYNEASSPLITECTFTGNFAGNGAGLQNISGSNPTVSGCTFSANLATSYGGGIVNWSTSHPSLSNCTFIGNKASNGAGMVNLFDCSPSVANCIFVGNSASAQGGGMSNAHTASPIVTNCTFSGNSADSGGGMDIQSSGTVTVTNCTFSGNSAGVGGGIINAGGSNPTVTNCVLWGNSDSHPGTEESAQIYVTSGTPTVNFSIVQGGWTGAGETGNSASDPFFVDADGADNIPGTIDDNLRLQSGSPAIDAADTTALPLDTFDLDGDGNTTERLSLDLAGNPRILDDPFTDDTGVPGSGVVDMGAFEYFSDCNSNGIPDDCDVNCGPIFGPCEMFDCETVADCTPHNCCQTGHGAGCLDPVIEACVCTEDAYCCETEWDETCVIEVTSLSCGTCGGNGIPDECDIAACEGDPACSDCNHNDVPDECDIASGTSLDVDPADGAPDECDGFVGACAPPDSDKWSCPGNWFKLLPGTYPDDVDSAIGVFVELDNSDNVFFDVDATIPALDMLAGTTLRITQTGMEGDLDFSAPAEMEIRGTILIAGGRTIGATGIAPDVIVGENGSYREDPSSTTSTTATLHANNVTILGSDGGNPGGKIELTSQMSLIVDGNLLLEGSEIPFPFNVAGITPPPKLRLARLARAVIAAGGDMIFDGVVEVDIETAATDGVSLSGHFVNYALAPSLYDWSEGALTMTGPDAQDFEVAGLDIGNIPEGFQTDRDTSEGETNPHSNFAMGVLQLGTDTPPVAAHVTFLNGHTNTRGTVPCDEALYVRKLIVKPGSTITLNNCRVYYGKIEPDDGSVVPTVLGPCGAMQRVGLPSAPTADPLGKPRSLTLTVPIANTSGPGTLTALRVRMIDLQHPSPANVPASTTRDFSAFDLAENGVCTGGSHNGHHCDKDADCRLCASGNGMGLPCTSDAECRRCVNDSSIVCINAAQCSAVGGNCGIAGLCPATGGTCANLTECTAANETEDTGCSAGNACGNCARWVGRPETFREAQEVDLGEYRGARLQCTPFYYDWAAEGQIHVVGAEILPSSIYHVERFAVECAGNEVTCAAVSDAVVMTTRRGGDVVSPFNPPSATTQPDVTDIGQIVAKFKKAAGSPSNTRALIQPNVPDLNSDVGVSDIVQVVDMVKQQAYPFGGPCPCPSLAVCGAVPCPGGAGTCTASGAPGLGAEATCIKLCRGGTNAGEQCNNHTHCGGGGVCDKECVGGTNNGQGCSGNPDCGKVCVGGPTPGASCVDASTCGGGTCPTINCTLVTNNAFCRDRCGRCTP